MSTDISATVGVTSAIVGDPSTIDDEELRADRRRRMFDAMDRHGLDALVIGRPAEVAFACGARQLWTAGSRPFGPAAVAVRETGRVHLLSVTDADVPAEVRRGELYGLWWNPANLARDLARIPGLRTARRVGTTSSSPGFARLLGGLAPDATEVDGSVAMWEARLAKSDAEVQRIVAATAIARLGLAAMEAALVPGVTERHLRAVWYEALAAAGAPTPPTEGVVCATPTEGAVRLRRLDSTSPIGRGQMVVLDPGGHARGYEGGVGRTRVVGDDPTDRQRELAARVDGATAAVVGACSAGVTGADLLAAWTSSGVEMPDEPIVTGVGLGLEPPVVGVGVGHDAVIRERTVLAVTGWAGESGVGGALRRDLVLVTEDGPRVLTGDVPGLAGGGGAQ